MSHLDMIQHFYYNTNKDLGVFSEDDILIHKKLNINQLDDDECTPLGYVVNDDLWYEIKCGEITSVNEGCNDTSLIIQTIDTLRSYGAKCIYNGEFYNEKWIDQYIVELKKQV